MNLLLLLLAIGFTLCGWFLDRQDKRLKSVETWRDQITEYCKKGTGEDVSA